MASLLRIELRIRGEYRDLWLYKGTLHVWTRDGDLRYVTFDVALKYVSRIYGVSTSNLVQTLIFRNDWKVGEQFASWMKVSTVRTAILAPFRENGILTVELPEGLFTRSDSEAYGGIVLDTNIYADRLYLATSEGLLESYINSKHLDYEYGLDQQTDFRASRVAVKYAAINVSAESQGLHFAPVSFSSDELGRGFRKADWRQVADFSLASSFAWRNLLNYTQASVPSLLRAQVEERRKEGALYDDTSVIGYEPGATDITSLAYTATVGAKKVTSSKLERGQLDDVDFEVLGNSDYHLLVSWGSQLRVIDLRAGKGRELEARPNERFRRSHLRSAIVDGILATYPISSGFVVEFYNRLDLITASGSFQLASGEAAQVRTFDSSLRHKEVVVAVQEVSTSVFGFYLADGSEDLMFNI